MSFETYLRQKIKEHDLSISEFARLIDRPRLYVYRWFKPNYAITAKDWNLIAETISKFQKIPIAQVFQEMHEAQKINADFRN